MPYDSQATLLKMVQLSELTPLLIQEAQYSILYHFLASSKSVRCQYLVVDFLDSVENVGFSYRYGCSKFDFFTQ